MYNNFVFHSSFSHYFILKDEKVQRVLGHFQKDFGGVSAENLGAKFGGYGSFLPTYHRSPSVLSQPKSPPRFHSHNMPGSPKHLVTEVYIPYVFIITVQNRNFQSQY